MILFGMLGALTFALQVAMAALPNIEPVSLLVMLFAVVLTSAELHLILQAIPRNSVYHVQWWDLQRVLFKKEK